jgi:hypothetical protein
VTEVRKRRVTRVKERRATREEKRREEERERKANKVTMGEDGGVAGGPRKALQWGAVTECK